MKGKVRKLVHDRGFGFISTENGRSIFFHRSDLEGVDFSQLKEGTGVEFNLTETPKGPQAINVKPEMAILPVAALEAYVRPYVEQAEQLRQERDEALAHVAELERELGRLEERLEAQERRGWLRRLLRRIVVDTGSDLEFW